MTNTNNLFDEGCQYLDNLLEKRMTNINWSMINDENFGLKNFQDLLFNLYGDHIRFMIDNSTGLIWNGKVWIKDDMEMYNQRIHFNILCLLNNQTRNADEESTFAKWIRRQTNRSTLMPLKFLASINSNITCYSHHFDQYDNLLTCKNGIINLRNGDLLPASKELYLSQYVDIEYSMANPGNLELFQNFIHQTFEGDMELIHYFQRFMGSCLTGYNTDQIFTLFHGQGRNGKSIITSLLQTMMPKIVQNVQAYTFIKGSMNESSRSDVARTKDYRIVIADETNPNAVLDEGLVKQMTSGDMITARERYCNEISFKPKYKIILSTNHLPQFRGKDLGIKRRLRVIPFNYTVPVDQINPYLCKELLAIKESILWWIVQGAIAWFHNGLGMCSAVQIATERYIQEADSVSMFMNRCCQPNPKGKIPAKDFFNYYQMWCKQNKYLPVSIRDFSTNVLSGQQSPIEKKRTSQGFVYTGIELFQ